jgi:hypothetical protein
LETGTTVLSKLITWATLGGLEEGNVSTAAICASPGAHHQRIYHLSAFMSEDAMITEKSKFAVINLSG